MEEESQVGIGKTWQVSKVKGKGGIRPAPGFGSLHYCLCMLSGIEAENGTQKGRKWQKLFDGF